MCTINSTTTVRLWMDLALNNPRSLIYHKTKNPNTYTLVHILAGAHFIIFLTEGNEHGDPNLNPFDRAVCILCSANTLGIGIDPTKILAAMDKL